jgi:hypothetical protein
VRPPPLSVRLDTEDRWRLAELVAALARTPSDVVRQLLRAAVPCPARRFAAEPEDDPSDDDPAERDTLPPGVDPRQLELEDLDAMARGFGRSGR